MMMIFGRNSKINCVHKACTAQLLCHNILFRKLQDDAARSARETRCIAAATVHGYNPFRTTFLGTLSKPRQK